MGSTGNSSLMVLCAAGEDTSDPDITGIGIVVSFLATATLSLIACFIGYFGDLLISLPHTEVDLELTTHVRPIVDRLLPDLGKGTSRRRCRGIEKFFLAVADTQMATSFAIMIAVAVKLNDISTYSLWMAWTMALSSLIVHLATIRCCPRYLERSNRFAIVRITLVLHILIGTTVLQFFAVYALASARQVVDLTASSESARWGLRAACVIREMPTRPVELETCILWAAVMYYYYFNILAKVFDRKMLSDSSPGNPPGYMSSVAETGHEMAEVSGPPPPPPPPPPPLPPPSSSFLYRFMMHKVLGNTNLGPFDSYEDMWTERQKWVGTVRMPRPRTWSSRYSQLDRRLQQVLYALVDVEAAYLALNTSIFADIPWLLFVLVFSWTQTVWYWRFNDAPGPVDEGTMAGSAVGFGQIVALLLLVIPVLAGIEAFLEAAEIGPMCDSSNSSADYKSSAIGDARVRKALRWLAVWYTLVMIYAAVVTGSPFFSEPWGASSALASVASLFVWQAYLELTDLAKKVAYKLRIW
ncbi:hypothetical protein QBC34DRAFT_380699 [Podospora aff. communis PSN243]|uniref:Uncharacterized protein n=1 Tax=Podospora aff. communis PSN243 TaxID=3040156 RepID=A0AAV9GNA7_9PEZI|nr:hypothetical protein QBC34DRAFT_380699 [Podospora aff. communis PSN243]